MKLRNSSPLLALLVFLVACEDKAEAPFREAEKAYAEQRFDDALSQLENASKAWPDTEYGIKAAMRFKTLTDEVAKKRRAQERIDSVERRNWLQSDNPMNWEKLIKKFPKSLEVEEAQTQLDQHRSFCADRQSWLKQLSKEATALQSLHAGYLIGIRDANGAMERQENQGAVRKQAMTHAKTMKEATELLTTHGIRDGETQLHTDVLNSYRDVSSAYEKYVSLYRGKADHSGVLRTHTIVAKSFADAVPALVVDTNSKCKALGPMPSSTETTQAAAKDPKSDTVDDSKAEEVDEKEEEAADEDTDSTEVEKDAEAVLDEWLDAQNDQNFANYKALYAAEFRGVKRVELEEKYFARAAWLFDRKGMFSKSFSVVAKDVKITKQADGALVVRFEQKWSSANYSDVGTKELILKVVDGELRIVREEQLDSTKL